jgi:hypothetical protein
MLLSERRLKDAVLLRQAWPKLALRFLTPADCNWLSHGRVCSFDDARRLDQHGAR